MCAVYVWCVDPSPILVAKWDCGPRVPVLTPRDFVSLVTVHSALCKIEKKGDLCVLKWGRPGLIALDLSSPFPRSLATIAVNLSGITTLGHLNFYSLS